MGALTDPNEEFKLKAFKGAEFDWVTRLNNVWADQGRDVAELHFKQRSDLADRLLALAASPFEQSATRLGVVYVGDPGAGKTHFLSFVRREAFALGLNFVLVDMTDVRDFWPTVTLGYLESLGRYIGGQRTQLEIVLRRLVELAMPGLDAGEYIDLVARLEPGILNRAIGEVLNGLARCSHCTHKDLLAHRNVIRSLFILNSRYFETKSVGHTWLQGVELDAAEAAKFEIKPAKETHSAIVKGLSWVMGLKSSTVLAFDQLEAIVAQYNLAAGDVSSVELRGEQKTALSIIEGIASGLSAVVDLTTRTLPVVTAVNSTWDVLLNRGLKAHADRFERPPIILGSIAAPDVARAIVEGRLSLAYRRMHFSPPYLTWPFKPSFFQSLNGAFPRQVLQRCAEHQRWCAANSKVVELGKAGPPSGKRGKTQSLRKSKIEEFEAALEHARSEPALLEEDQEDALGELVLQGCKLLLKETDPPTGVNRILDDDFTSNKRFPSLHARIRTIFQNEGDREEHVCLRVLQRTNPMAYKARLTAAMTAAGIDRGLSFRKLMVIRTTPPMTGLKMTELTGQFEKRGGVTLGISAEDIGKLRALAMLATARDPDFDDWLRTRKPVSGLSLFSRIFPPTGEGPPNIEPLLPPKAKLPKQETYSSVISEKTRAASPATAQGASQTSAAKTSPELKSSGATLLIGRRLIAGKPETNITLDPAVLSRHVIIRAGSGGGKTVLLKRLVEEAALCGIPSILVDPANDLAQIGDPWPVEPEFWLSGDADRAHRYHDSAEVVVWTPGRTAGRSLQLSPLPDFSAAADDDDQLNASVAMAVGSLEQYVAAGASERAKVKKGVLAAALKYYAQHAPATGDAMTSLIELLSDLPSEAGGGIKNSEKLAASIADGLRAALLIDPLLRGGDQPLDPAVLFGLNESGRTRISVISLIGLPTPDGQQNFVNQLAMALFSWIKKHPSVGPSGMTGLLVIDEARDFLPATQKPPCKESLQLLASQARKYGLGLVLATQNPMDLDYKAVSQFSTQFFGKANSPQVIEFIKKQIVEKGGSADDIARLQKGQFYLASEGIQPPVKMLAPMCLSYHPEGKPLTEEEIITRAKPLQRVGS